MIFRKLIVEKLLPRLILEFDEKRTWDNFGIKVLKRLRNDRSWTDHYRSKLPWNRLFVAKLGSDKEELNTEDGYVKFAEDVKIKFFSEIKQFDPTQNQEYTRWLVQTYSNGGIPFWEDMGRALGALTQYHRQKITKRLLPTEKDIFQVKTLTALETIVESHEENVTGISTTTETEKAELKKAIAESELIDSSDKALVLRLKSAFAGAYWGRGTVWCTRNSSSTYLSYANRGDLYVFIPKHPKYDDEKYQMHTPNSDLSNIQLMDRKDHPVSFTELLDMRPEFTNAFWKIFGVVDPEIVNGVRGWAALGFRDNSLLRFVVERKEYINDYPQLFTKKFCDWALSSPIASRYVTPSINLNKLDLKIVAKIFANNSEGEKKTRGVTGKERIIKSWGDAQIATIDGKSFHLIGVDNEIICIKEKGVIKLFSKDGKSAVELFKAVGMFDASKISTLTGIDERLLILSHKYSSEHFDDLILKWGNRLLEFPEIAEEGFSSFAKNRPWKLNQMKQSIDNMKVVIAQFKSMSS